MLVQRVEIPNIGEMIILEPEPGDIKLYTRLRGDFDFKPTCEPPLPRDVIMRGYVSQVEV